MSPQPTMLIIGSGPSTRELIDWGLDNLPAGLDTFGMGASYRFFRRIGWWPTYYALADSKVVFSHRRELAEIVEDPDVTTRRFFLSWPVCHHPRLELIAHSSTGGFCFRRSLQLGYRSILLIGIEGHYVEELSESRPLSESEYHELGFDQLNLRPSLRETLRVFTETPQNNPNYFFSDYQRVGDVYSLPQSGRHRNRWKEAAQLADSFGVDILNLSESSKVHRFPKAALSTALEDHQEVRGASASADSRAPASFWYGPFRREQQKRLDEAAIVLDLFDSGQVQPSGPPIMVDVGACKGGAFRGFARRRWVIHAFEPNPSLARELEREFDGDVFVHRLAVSDAAAEGVAFYTSEESLGIGTLAPFRTTHESTASVDVITLGDYLESAGLDRVDFLKIDAEGFDLKVLQGVDLKQHSVEVIVCEFEDLKTERLGYSTDDMAKHLESFGYAVYVSEWYPIVRYGGPHQWRMLKRYPCRLEDPKAWGNLFAFKSDPGICALTRAVKRSLRRFERISSADAKPAVTDQDPRARRPSVGKKRSRLLAGLCGIVFLVVVLFLSTSPSPLDVGFGLGLVVLLLVASTALFAVIRLRRVRADLEWRLRQEKEERGRVERKLKKLRRKIARLREAPPG